MLKGLAKQKQVSFEKSGLVPHGQTSKGSVAGREQHREFFRTAGSKRQLREAFPGQEQLSRPRDFKVALREVRS